ncbi:MAG: M48 family metalloprotease [Rhodospirillales bacterium]
MRTMGLAAVALTFGLFWHPASAADTTHARTTELAFFGSDSDLGKDGKLLDKISPDDLFIKPTGAPVDGRQLARREAKGPDQVPVPLPKAKRFAEDVMRRIVEGVGITGYTPKIEIVSAGDISASAYPDGTVLITLGALRNLDSADELAAVLAHELSHVILRHHGSDWFMDAQNRGLGLFNMVLDIKEQLDKLSDDGDTDKQFLNMKRRIVAETVVFASDILIDAPFDREQEDEADLLGTDLLIKAGYNADAMTFMLAKLAEQEERNKKRQEAENQTRRTILAAAQDTGFFSGLMGAFGEIASDLKTEIRDQVGKSHRPASERRTMVSEYLGRHYTDPTLVQSAVAPWQAMVNDPDVKRVLDGYKAALEARRMLTAYDVDGAAAKSREALQLLDSNHPLPHTVAAEISYQTADFDKAAAFFGEALAGYQASLGNYAGLAETEVKRGHAEASVRIIGAAEAALQEPPQLLPAKIAALRASAASSGKANASAQALGFVAECKVSGIEGLGKHCERAATGKYSVFVYDLPPKVRGKKVDPGTPAPAKQRVQIARPSVNARGGPGTTYDVVESYGRGMTLTVLAERNKWFRVLDPSGRETWVASWLTAPAGSVNTAPKAARTPEPKPAPASTAKNPAPDADPNPEPAPQAAVSEEAESIEVRLKKLKNWHQQGLISDEEYDTKRKEILDAL